MEQLVIPEATLAIYVLTLSRVGGMIAVAPFFSSGSVIPWVRIFLAVGLAWTILPSVEGTFTALPQDGVGFFLLVGREFLVGLLIGFVARLLFASLELAGFLMGFQMGFSFIQIVDPQTQVESPFLGILLSLTGTLIFLLFNGHHWLIQAVVESYQVGTSGLSMAGVMEEMIRSVGLLFSIGLKVAAPVAVTLFLVDILFGILGRAAPQLHLLVIGLPAKTLVGFVVLSATIYSLVPFIARYLGSLEGELERYLILFRG